MTEPVLLSELPLDSIKVWLSSKYDYGVLIRPDEQGCIRAWYWGMTHQQAAKVLYGMADEVVDQHIPPHPGKQ